MYGTAVDREQRAGRLGPHEAAVVAVYPRIKRDAPVVRSEGRPVLGEYLGGVRYRLVDVIADLEYADNLPGRCSSLFGGGPVP
jgi:hypothetical protein